MKTAIKTFLIIVLSFHILDTQEKQTEFPELTDSYLGEPQPDSSPVIFAKNIVSSIGRAMHSTLAVSPDESYILYAVTKRIQGLQKNFCHSKKNKEGNWSNPFDVGNLIGEKDTGHFIGVSTDQKYLFYTSITPSQRENLHWINSTSIIGQVR